EIAVAQHHAHRLASCATGIKDAGEVRVVTTTPCDRCCLEQVRIGAHTVGQDSITEIDDFTHASHLAPELIENRGKAVIDEEDFRARILKDVLDLRGRQSDVDRDYGTASERHAQEKLEVEVAVKRQNGDPPGLG